MHTGLYTLNVQHGDVSEEIKISLSLHTGSGFQRIKEWADSDHFADPHRFSHTTDNGIFYGYWMPIGTKEYDPDITKEVAVLATFNFTTENEQNGSYGLISFGIQNKSLEHINSSTFVVCDWSEAPLLKILKKQKEKQQEYENFYKESK